MKNKYNRKFYIGIFYTILEIYRRKCNYYYDSHKSYINTNKPNSICSRITQPKFVKKSNKPFLLFTLNFLI